MGKRERDNRRETVCLAWYRSKQMGTTTAMRVIYIRWRQPQTHVPTLQAYSGFRTKKSYVNGQQTLHVVRVLYNPQA